MQNAWRTLVRVAVSIGVSLLILGLLLGLVSESGGAAEKPRLLLILRHTAIPFVGLYVVLAFVQAFFRACRYRLLIAASDEKCVPGMFHTYLVTLTRNMLIDLLPARLGELSYIAMMNRGYSVSGQACVSSLAISFVFDFLALAVVIAAILAAEALLPAGAAGWLVSLLLAVSAAVVVMAVGLFWGVRWGVSLLKRIIGPMEQRSLAARLLAFGDTVASALEATRRAGVLGRVLSLSLAVRLSKYVGLYCTFHAVAAPSFPELARASASAVWGALLSAEVGASLPIPAFMSFGTYEAGGTLALTLLGFSVDTAKIAMLAVHIWSQSVDYLLGGGAFVAFLFVTGRLARTAGIRPRALPTRIAAALATALLVLAAGGWLGWRYRAVAKMGTWAPPPCGNDVQGTDAERAAAERLTAPLRGFVVWSSNRSGNHDLFLLSLPHRAVRQLTTHPHVDTFPRLSPDGRRVLFARSQTPWVSQRNPVPWDTYVLDLESGRERLVATNAYSATWGADGTTVCFQRNSDRIVLRDLRSGAERVVFQAGQGLIPAGVQLQAPSLGSRDGALAATFRGAHRAAVAVCRDRIVPIARSGCQMVWTPDQAGLGYVDAGERQKNAIYHYDWKAGTKRPWLDMIGEFSHEYFPQVSRDSRYLVLGASRGGRGDHEHDTGDYEIFLWKIGNPPDRVARLTFHSGNDCWPDIFLQ